MPLQLDIFSVLLNALAQKNSAAFARALDAEKQRSPISAHGAAEYMILRMFTSIDSESPRPTAAEKMFIKAAEVLEELTPVLIYDENARESMRRSLMIADAVPNSKVTSAIQLFSERSQCCAKHRRRSLLKAPGVRE